ncbi:regulatory protein RecX [Variovorax sp. HJSM1_2]|uniref:regulatory protein RecX n=1 Tax=Variovorax sp. HJSM1_2 TaxID=3366263 RepID=UPI003BCE904F
MNEQSARRAVPPISLKGRALRLLSGREYSRYELERKLAPHEAQPGELARALDELQAKGFISDQRAAASVVHRRSARMGAARVAQEMQRKGLGQALVSEAVQSLRDTEYERALEVWRKKYGHRLVAADESAVDEAPVDPQIARQVAAREKVRQMRFLLTRGFAPEVIRRVVRDGPEGLEDDL